MTKQMPAEPAYLKADVQGGAIGVDRKARTIRGYVLAQAGPFKTPGRGQFDEAALAKIVELGNAQPAGLKSRFTHPSMSDDGLGSFLGRAHDLRLGEAMARGGQKVAAVRGDLHLADAAFTSPKGNLGDYVLDLAEQDPDALSSSLVLRAEKVYTLDDNGQRKKDDKGDDLPPIWKPTKLHASDIVDTGDAVDGLLSAGIGLEGLPDELQRRGFDMLNQLFADQPRDVVRKRVLAYLDRYLAVRYGDDELAERRAELRKRIEAAKSTLTNLAPSA